MNNGYGAYTKHNTHYLKFEIKLFISKIYKPTRIPDLVQITR